MESWSGAIEWHVGVAFWGGFKFLLPIPLLINLRYMQETISTWVTLNPFARLSC